MTLPLDGLRVLELGVGMPVALAGMMLADYGAEVIKVEPPAGDPSRETPAWLNWGRGKKSVVLDLHEREAQARARQLAGGADALLHNLRPGVAQRFGIGYEELAALNPALVYCAISGFGPRGRRARLKGYPGVFAAVSGLAMEYARLTEGRPAYPDIQTPSYGAAQAALQGVLAALLVRERTGRGQLVETSLVQGLSPFDMMEWFNHQLALKYPDAFAAPAEAKGAHNFLALMCGRTRDGQWLQFNNLTPRQFGAFLAATGLGPKWDEAGGTRESINLDYENHAGRMAFWHAFLERIGERTLAEWMEVFLADPNIGVELIRHMDQVLDHPQLRHNGQVSELEREDGTRVEGPGPLARILGGANPAPARPPALGEHQGEVLGSLRPAPAPHARGGPAPRYPLDGITVVETTNYYAAPFGTAVLADLGARLIKIEPPTGDLLRWFLPVPETGAVKTNQGKESVSLDLKHPEARAVFERIVAQADVFVHNYRPDVVRRMGLDEATLRALNPDMVYVHATGYGLDGPFAHRPMYAQTATAITGNPIRQAGNQVPPPGAAVPFEELERLSFVLKTANRGDGDPVAALGLASAVLIGLHARAKTGVGPALLTSMICSNVYANSDECVRYGGRPPVQLMDRAMTGRHALDRLYETAEGWVHLAAPQAKEWAPLCRALEAPALAADGRFATAAARRDNDATLAACVAACLRSDTAAHWEARMDAEDVACAEVFRGTMAQYSAIDAEYVAQGFMAEVDHPLFGSHLRHGAITHFSTVAPRLGPGCLVGDHTRAMLAELGYSEAEAERLKAAGAVHW